MESPIPTFIGYDRRMPIVYHVAAHSIARRAGVPVLTTPLMLDVLRKSGLMTRLYSQTNQPSFRFRAFLSPIS